MQGAGIFSKLGGYIGGTRAATAASNWGQLGSYAAKTAWGTNTGKGAMIGAGLGGLYGAASNDTSVLGGMMMGAGLGAGGARYGGAGINRMNNVGFVTPKSAVQEFGKGAYGQMRGDYRKMYNTFRKKGITSNTAINSAAVTTATSSGSKLSSNTAINSIPSIKKGNRWDKDLGVVAHQYGPRVKRTPSGIPMPQGKVQLALPGRGQTSPINTAISPWQQGRIVR